MSPSKSAASEANPSYLPSRYEIRQLGPEHHSWAAAIVCHSNIFCSPMWTAVYPENQTQRLYDMIGAAEYLVSHQINSGLSYGVFDKEYVFKRPESAPTEGKLYWNQSKLEVDSDALLEQMDFPLASVALAYDGINALDFEKLKPLIAVMPLFAQVYSVLEATDQRDPASWKPTGPHQVLMRNATSSRADYEGQGLMKKLAQWLMREAAGKGFRGIQIECVHNAVIKVWSNPPEPFKGHVISTIDPTTHEAQDEEGKKFKPFYPSTQLIKKIYVDLKPNEPAHPDKTVSDPPISAQVGAIG